MTDIEAIEILNDFNNVEGSAVISMTSLREANDLAIKALDLLVRLEGFKYVTTDVMLRENELAHFDIYKKGWNDAIEAVKVASDRPLSEIINEIKETEVCEGYND